MQKKIKTDISVEDLEKERAIKAALKRFPALVKQQRLRYEKRQKFLKETFGPLVRQVRAIQRRQEKK